uniref:Chemosensory protein n=1 Tax=Corythucha ciliata TaxID=369451 RepID=A0A2S0M1E0_CORCT|nr:chemosensory protein [Corythucha ciliata]
MKAAPGVIVVLLVAVCSVTQAGESKYTTKYDNVDLDEILRNTRLYDRYIKCLTNKDDCSPDGKELRDILPDALKTKCAKCSEKQKSGAEKVLKFIYEKKRTDFDELEKIYDPKGTYRKEYEVILKKAH